MDQTRTELIEKLVTNCETGEVKEEALQILETARERIEAEDPCGTADALEKLLTGMGGWEVAQLVAEASDS